MNDLDKLFANVLAQARAQKIPFSQNINTHIKVNSHAVRRFGLCQKVDGKYTIEVAAILLEADEKFVAQTIAHELLHTCAGCENHGALWQTYAKKMNEAYGYNISRANAYEEAGLGADCRKKARYILQCVSCGRKIERYRKSRLIESPQNFRCKCGGRLKRIL